MTSKSGRGPPSFSQFFPFPALCRRKKTVQTTRGQVTGVLAPAREYCLRARERHDFAFPPREVSPAAGPHSPAPRGSPSRPLGMSPTPAKLGRGSQEVAGRAASRSRCSPASLRGRRAAGKGSARQGCSAGRAELPFRSGFPAGRPFQSEPDSRQLGFHARRIARSRRARGSAARKNASPRVRGCQRLSPLSLRRNPPPSPNHLKFLNQVDLKRLIPAA